MNILVLNWRGPKHPNAGGAEQATLEHAKGWIRAGHKVTWFASSYTGCSERENYEGIDLIRRGNQVLSVHFQAVLWYHLSQHQNFDLVIDQFHGIPFFTPLYIRAKKISFIHEVTKEVWFMNNLPGIKHYVYGIFGYITEPFIFRLIYRNIKFITVSNSTKNDLIKFGIKPNNITVVHNGISKPKHLSKYKKNKIPTILSLGALAKDKGSDEVFRVYDSLHKKNKNWRFWIAGNGDEKYKKMIKRRKYIKYFGYVDEETKFSLFAKAKIFVNLSHREGWGLTNIEANSQSTPVVGFNVPGMNDSVVNNKTGVLVEKGKSDDLSQIIIDLIGNTKKYKQMSKDAKIWSLKFSWDKSCKQSLDLVESL